MAVYSYIPFSFLFYNARLGPIPLAALPFHLRHHVSDGADAKAEDTAGADASPELPTEEGADTELDFNSLKKKKKKKKALALGDEGEAGEGEGGEDGATPGPADDLFGGKLNSPPTSAPSTAHCPTQKKRTVVYMQEPACSSTYTTRCNLSFLYVVLLPFCWLTTSPVCHHHWPPRLSYPQT